jgi:uncharacterized protein with NAD-binding domain and iron-sulfur cluster
MVGKQGSARGLVRASHLQHHPDSADSGAAGSRDDRSHPIAVPRLAEDAGWSCQVKYLRRRLTITAAISEKKRVVILGGGVAGMAAAFGITRMPDWQQEYEVTVYQLGWRLGGKGASGRQGESARIQEHGLHVWGGFYENAFRMMRACYEELDRPPTAPLARWDQAFLPLPLVSFTEDLAEWLDWSTNFPQYPSTPGDGNPMPSLWEGVVRIVEWILQTLEGGTLASGTPTAPPAQEPAWVLERLETHGATVPRRSGTAEWLIAAAAELARAVPPGEREQDERDLMALGWLLSAFRDAALPDAPPEGPDGLRRALILTDLAATEVIGMIEDGVLIHGFDVIDGEDLAAWYTRHGAKQASVESGLLRGMYDFIFAYRGGCPDQPSLAAGVGLRLVLRLVMWSKGAIFYRMAAGMGDAVFAPLYLALAKQGVKFRFFQLVENLEPTADGRALAAITIGEQAQPKDGPYRPLIEVAGLPCWPAEPQYDQLLQGEELKQLRIDLESPWSPWPPVDHYQLVAGQDFDIAVLATSLAPLRDIAAPLIAANLSWNTMVEQIQSVPTQAFQLWLDPTLEKLGWTPGPTVLTAFAHPFETWADMSQVIDRELWPSGETPGSIAYFCGVQPDIEPLPPYSDHGFPARQQTAAHDAAMEWVEQNLATLWPAAGTPGSFDWSLLHAAQGQSGPARFESQYWRANISPAERYVLSVPGTTAARLRPGSSGFSNLYLAGDWVHNGLNVGCVESAAMGGLEAAQAICGYPKEIVGQSDFASD